MPSGVDPRLAMSEPPPRVLAQPRGAERWRGPRSRGLDGRYLAAVTWQHQNRDVALDLVGVAEIAEMLGVSRQRVHQIARDDGAFPGPVAKLSAGNVWLRSDIERWMGEAGRGGG